MIFGTHAANNSVFIDGTDRLLVRFEGDQTKESLRLISDQIIRLIHDLRLQNKAVNLLVDTTELGKTDAAVMNEASEGVAHFDLDKMAVFGETQAFTRWVMNSVIEFTGKKDKIRLFESQVEAEAWLG
jgi:hypothetical protein